MHHDMGLMWQAVGVPQPAEWRGPRPVDDLERHWMGLSLGGEGSSRGAFGGADEDRDNPMG